jgi:hypothetical protein
VVPTHHDEDVTPFHHGPDVGHADSVDEEVTLAFDVFHRVRGERLDLDGQPGPRLDHRGLDGFDRLHVALADRLVVEVDDALVHPDQVAVLDPLEQLGGGVVDERHPGVDDDLRAQVGVTATDTRGDVDHACHSARDKRLRAHPVNVNVIDNRDFPRPETLGQPLGPPIDSRHCRHPGKVRDLPTAEVTVELALKPFNRHLHYDHPARVNDRGSQALGGVSDSSPRSSGDSAPPMRPK